MTEIEKSIDKKEVDYQREMADRYPELISKKAAYRQDAESRLWETEMSEPARQLYNVIEPCMVQNHMPLEYLARACEIVRAVFSSEALLPKDNENKEVAYNG